MKILLRSPQEKVIYSQEVLVTGKLPEIIKWKGRLFLHYFTDWPKGRSVYQETEARPMPPKLPPTVHPEE